MDAAAQGRGHLQDPREDAEDRAADQPAVHARTPGAANWSSDYRTPRGGQDALRLRRVQHGPVPAARRPARRSPATATASGPPKGYPAIALQLFVMDDGRRHRRRRRPAEPREDRPPEHRRRAASGGADDGRIMFSTLESQGIRGDILWGIWRSIPTARTGTRWSARSIPAARRTASTSRRSLPTARSSSRSTTTRTTAASAPTSSCRRSRRRATPAFGPAYMNDPRNPPLALRPARQRQGRSCYRMPFMPTGCGVAHAVRARHRRAGRPRRSSSDKNSPAVGKFTHPVRRAGQPPADASTRPARSITSTRTCRSSTAAST